PNIGLVYSGAEIIYDNLKLSYQTKPSKAGDLSKEILEMNYIGSTSSVIVRTNILQKTELFDEELRALQDYDLWIRICQKTNVGLVKEPLLNYYNILSATQISDDVEKYEKSLEYIQLKYENLYGSYSESLKRKFKQSSYILLANKSFRNNK